MLVADTESQGGSTDCLVTCNRCIGLITALEVPRLKVARGHLSRAVLVCIELPAHHQGLGNAAELIVTFPRVVQG